MTAIGKELGLAQSLSISRLVIKLQEIHDSEKSGQKVALTETLTEESPSKKS
jgi:hypothetical protein